VPRADDEPRRQRHERQRREGDEPMAPRGASPRRPWRGGCQDPHDATGNFWARP
jgi:hypothetical protein